jgi:hypothetical protein
MLQLLQYMYNCQVSDGTVVQYMQELLGRTQLATREPSAQVHVYR